MEEQPIEGELSPEKMEEIRLEGSHAESPDDCPYIKDGFLYMLWMEGHNRRKHNWNPDKEIHHEK